MNPTVIVVLSILALSVVLSVVWAAVGARRVTAFEQACRERGWTVERVGQGFGQRISGSTAGISWRYDYLQDSYRAARRDTDEVHTGLLSVESAALPGEVVLILPRWGRPGQVAGVFNSIGKLGLVGRMVLETFVTRVLGGESSDLEMFTKLAPVQAGSEAVRQSYVVLATGEEVAERVLRRGESALVAFAANPASQRGRVPILLWRKGLALPVERHLNRIERLEALVNLITGLANAVKG